MYVEGLDLDEPIKGTLILALCWILYLEEEELDNSTQYVDEEMVRFHGTSGYTG